MNKINSVTTQSAIIYRKFRAEDTAGVNAVAVAAFRQYQHQYSNWNELVASLATAAGLADIGEMMVAEQDGHIVGAVAYIAPDPDRRHACAPYFDAHWAVMRMLVVDPTARGLGIGHTLAQFCITCAKRDQVAILALHTSTMMTVAQPMYLRMGFKLSQDLAPIGGVAYRVYTLMMK